ncbi:hypothetical protein T265_04000 [Opisthorchis viverrini]|uniref:Uncharacterized protein n=1 Tax=Opisthorchis viverrini TaxID=6198 RepID=A0A074ZPI8_OPIVI|nr:hypothetical protein T265_04000 [Opisthorchis viverrini]KER29338.1 hypothetical protein T265_04000 [Opisthorchis viverrini]
MDARNKPPIGRPIRMINPVISAGSHAIPGNLIQLIMTPDRSLYSIFAVLLLKAKIVPGVGQGVRQQGTENM